MNRTRFAFAATCVGAALFGAAALAQTTTQNPPAPPPGAPVFKSVLAGKKFDPPFKGQAEVEFTQPVTKREKDKVVTTVKVKNLANGPLDRFTIDETWFDKSGSIVAGSKGVLKERFKPGEIQTVTIETDYSSKMNGNSWNFSHANGQVKPRKVKSLDDEKEPAAKSASATKSTKTSTKSAAKKK